MKQFTRTTFLTGLATLAMTVVLPFQAFASAGNLEDALGIEPLPVEENDMSMVGDEESFDTASALSDEELSKHRGGFITIGGMLIEFGLATRIIVDGVTQTDIAISSENLQQITPDALKQVVQIGPGNNAALESLAQLPGLLTVIQNSQNDKLIQNLTNLDIGVQNVQSFHDQALTNAADFHAVEALR